MKIFGIKCLKNKREERIMERNYVCNSADPVGRGKRASGKCAGKNGLKHGFKVIGTRAAEGIAHITYGRAFFAFLALLSLILMLRNSGIAIEYLKNGLGLCAKNVIPSLFPFMVLSELIVAFGAGDMISSVIGRPVGKIFGISGKGSTAFILGAVCGFPTGARTAVRLYDSGAISKRDCELLLTFTNNPSSAFVINSVGVSLYSNHRLGILLWCFTLLSSMITGIIIRFLFFGKKYSADRKNELSAKKNISSEDFEKSKRFPSAKDFTGAVMSSAMAMLYICAYVIFFAAFIGAFGNMLSALGASTKTTAVLFSVFELSSGVSEAAGIAGGGVAGIALCAFALGWSGISVHCQLMSLCDGRGLSYKPYFVAKAMQGLLNSLLVLISSALLPVGIINNAVGV